MVTAGATANVPEVLRSRVDVPRSFEPEDFRVPASGTSVDVHVIAVSDGTLVSEDAVRSARVSEGAVQPDPSTDLLKLAVIDRHSHEMRLATGFVSGFGFREGAVATTYCHVHYDLLTLGTSDDELAHAANVVREMGGGMAVVRGGQVVARWELPIVGIFTTQPLAAARDSFVALNDAIRSLGCSLTAPILALSFVALPTIPALGLTDRGLIDVASQSFVDVVLATA
jgi:adenine deaminase